MLVLKKCRKSPDDILFIDASRNFEKIKTQNVLLPEHINKIVEAYKTRKDEEKFSRVVSLLEIAGNDYNLNIPRYVDTFEAEEAIDLTTIIGKLAKLEEAGAKTNKTIAAFCRELGIEPPFKAEA